MILLYKKFVSLTLTIMMIFVLAACGAAETGEEGSINESANPEKFVENVKEVVDGAVGDGETIVDVTYAERDLCVTVDLSNASGPLSKEDLALARVSSITDEILSLTEFYDLWDTVTVDFGTVGKVVNTKENIVDDGYGPYFDDTKYILE